MENSKVWFVTGASKGLGFTFVQKLLKEGYRVAATSRTSEDLIKEFWNIPPEVFLPLTVDLKSDEDVGFAVENTIKLFGRIDVVVNNAGFGLAGALEEISDREARENFNINVFGSLNVIRKIMPQLRKQKSGHIFNISSIGGFNGNYPGWGIYCATKFAVHGFTESLAAEARPFGISATVVSLGYFRTNFLTADSLNVPKQQLSAYQKVRDSQTAHQNDINGNQPGDPEKAVEAMIRVANQPDPPIHLFLGQDAYDLACAKISAISHELEEWKTLTISTGYEQGH